MPPLTVWNLFPSRCSFLGEGDGRTRKGRGILFIGLAPRPWVSGLGTLLDLARAAQADIVQ